MQFGICFRKRDSPQGAEKRTGKKVGLPPPSTPKTAKRKRTKKATPEMEQIDSVLKTMVDSSKAKEQRMDCLLSKAEEDAQDDFWHMLARRVRGLNPRNRRKVEDGSWQLYLKVQEQQDNRTSSPEPQLNSHVSSRAPSNVPTYSLYQHQIHHPTPMYAPNTSLSSLPQYAPLQSPGPKQQTTLLYATASQQHSSVQSPPLHVQQATSYAPATQQHSSVTFHLFPNSSSTPSPAPAN